MDAPHTLGLWRRDHPRHLLHSPGNPAHVAHLQGGHAAAGGQAAAPEPRVTGTSLRCSCQALSRLRDAFASTGRKVRASRACRRPRSSLRSSVSSACWACGSCCGAMAAASRRGCRRGRTFQRSFLADMDWILMVYAAIVGVSHAVAYHHETQERKLKEAHLETRLMEAQLKTLAGPAPSTLPVQHAPRHFDADPPRSGVRRSDDQPAERSAADHVRPRAATPRSRSRKRSSSCRNTSTSSRHASRIVSLCTCRHRPGRARRRSAADDSAAAGRERDQARHRAAHRSRPPADRRRDAPTTRCGWKCATTVAGCTARR